MKLEKVEDGLLENYNYFLNVPIGDILGDGRCYRTDTTFILSEGIAERPFKYDEFVMVVEKDNSQLEYNDEIKAYIRADGRIYGLTENGNSEFDQSKEWKIIRYKDYVQAYMKVESKWVNLGGTSTEATITHQGFKVVGDQPLKIRDYKIYSSPYIYVFDVPKGYSANVIDKEGIEVFEKRYAEDDGIIELFVTDILEGQLVIYDDESEVILRSELIELKYGDKFSIVRHDLELRYRGRVLDYRPTKLDKRRELVYLYNTSDVDTYERIVVSVYNPNIDDIEISLDNENFSDKVYIPTLRPNHQRDIYIRIRRKDGNILRNRKFALEIDEY